MPRPFMGPCCGCCIVNGYAAQDFSATYKALPTVLQKSVQALDDTALMDWVSALTEEPSMTALLEPIVALEPVRLLPRQISVARDHLHLALVLRPLPTRATVVTSSA